MKLVFAKEMQSLDQQSAEQIGLPTNGADGKCW